MRRAVLVALLAAAVAVVIWRSRDQPAPAPRTVALPPVPSTPPHRAPALDVERPALPGKAVPAEVAQRLAGAHDALLASVDPCWDDPGPPQTPAGAPDATVQRLRVRYRLVVAAGQAHAADLEPLDSTISDPRMDRCLLDRIAAARWPSPGADAALAVSDVILLGDVARRRRPKGPM